MRQEGLLFRLLICFLQIGVTLLDSVLYVGFVYMNEKSISLLGETSLSLMCVSDMIASGLSFFKPKLSAYLILFTVGITAILSVASASRQSLHSLWLSGLLFWSFKLVIVYGLWPANNNKRGTQRSLT